MLPAVPAEQGKQEPVAAQEGCAAGGGKRGTHIYLPDERNKDVLVGIRDGMVPATFDLVRQTPFAHAQTCVWRSGYARGQVC